ncbi:hypothetical protein [Flavihumibacter sp. ZG627]|uniref:hypothetical protein n=1 Tax=Flavihumibacter sp. ZG627 TaxID=1463156 RepID=UPI00057D9CAE|nr:hypothetical protein [Flavihumibacter sp. ZG627]KIC91033.1 hypothetical protein HY58_08450 [Flavihumibacter sp. ZG627]
MPTIVARHKVGNFDTWLKGHQDRVNIFAPAISSFKTFQDADDPNSVVLVIEVTDIEKLGAIINDPANAHLKASHTVIDPITMSMPVDI